MRIVDGKMRLFIVRGKLIKALEFIQPWIGVAERINIANEETGLQEFDWIGEAR